MTKLPSQYKYKKAFWILAFTCVVLAVSYIALVGRIMANTLERQNTEKLISKSSAVIGELDFAYLKAKYAVNEDLASSLGFVENSKTLVAKKGAGISLSLNNEI